jgi:hypothetical protein
MTFLKNAQGAWKLLEAVATDTLTDARLQLHWASQVVASVGVTHLKPRPDDSHPNFEWVRGAALFAGHFTEQGDVLRAGLVPATLTLQVLDQTDRPTHELSLQGHTLDEAYDWLAQAITDFTHGERTTRLVRPPYDLPSHPVAEGATFTASEEGLEMLSRWYANADAFLRELAAGAGGSPVRCWPHHFDIATLITIDPGVDAEKARTLGVGMTPGDDSIGEPYWYVNPWPRPGGADLPELSAGQWHTEGWTGAVLTATDILGDDDPPGLVSRYLESALRAGRTLLGV